MSMMNLQEVECPECHSVNQFAMWSSMNTMINPELKQSVRDRSVFNFTCPTCGTTTPVSYDFLYHQMEDRLMIYLALSEETAEGFVESINWIESDPDRLIHSNLSEDYTFRVVDSQRDLLEKLAIFDAKLDDRVIEILKLFILAQYFEQNKKEREFESIIRITFANVPNVENDYFLYITKDDEYVGETPFPRELYNKLETMYHSVLIKDSKKEFFVNKQWALAAYASKPG